MRLRKIIPTKNVRENDPSNEISWGFYGVNRVAEITQDSADIVSLNSTCPLWYARQLHRSENDQVTG